MVIDDCLERHHAFEGCFNFRDIGGYPNQDGKRINLISSNLKKKRSLLPCWQAGIMLSRVDE